MTEGAYLYILRCADDSYYTGTARSGLEQRVAEHNAGTYGGYTAQRRPVTLVFSQWFDRITDAIAAERQVKGCRVQKRKHSFAVISIAFLGFRNAGEHMRKRRDEHLSSASS
jgi:predicted GIY-YIG superfamily endonuclease